MHLLAILAVLTCVWALALPTPVRLSGDQGNTTRRAALLFAVGVLAILAGAILWAHGARSAIYERASILVCFGAGVAYLLLVPGRRVLLGALMLVAAVADYPQAALITATALGAALLIDSFAGARGCALTLTLLTANDLVMWRLGALSHYLVGGLWDQAGHLHPLAAVNMGGWQLGTGDLLALALLAVWCRRRLTRFTWLPLIISLGGMALTGAAVTFSAGPLPATPPLAVALATGMLICRRTSPSPVANLSPAA